MINSVNHLTPKGPRIHSFKMTNLIDHTANNIIEMEPSFVSLESVKNIKCVGQNINKVGQKRSPI